MAIGFRTSALSALEPLVGKENSEFQSVVAAQDADRSE
jgi:hypothetical protein